MDEKANFLQRLTNVAKRAIFFGRMSYLRVYFDMKKTSSEFSSKKYEYKRYI